MCGGWVIGVKIGSHDGVVTVIVVAMRCSDLRRPYIYVYINVWALCICYESLLDLVIYVFNMFIVAVNFRGSYIYMYIYICDGYL